MNYRMFGRTGLLVSEISLGGLFFGKLAKGRNTAKTVARAHEVGINLIDTAAAYTGSEKDLGRALKKTGLRNRFIIATKWWPYDRGGKRILQSPSALRKSVEKSLRDLQTECIELFQFHSVTNRGDTRAILEGPLMDECERLKKAGKIRFLGISNSGEWDPDDARLREAARSGRFDAVMPEFLLFRQRPSRGLFRVCRKHNVGIITIIPLGQAAWGYGLRDRKYLVDSMKALIAKKKLPDRPVYRRAGALDFLLDRRTRTVPAAALRWCLSFPEVSTVCCGTNDPRHVEENARVSGLPPYSRAQLAKAYRLFGRIR